MSAKQAERLQAYEVRRGEGGRYFALVKCSYCRAEEEVNLRHRLPPEVIRQKFVDKGWQLPKRGGKTACLRCLTTFRSINKEQAMAKSGTMRLTASNASPDATQQRRLYALLEAKFDDKVGRYSDGYSDTRVAEEIGIAEASVRGHRESAFGRLAVPQELQDLKSELGSLKAMVGDLELRLDAELRKFK